MKFVGEFILLTVMEVIVVSLFGMFGLWANGGWLGLSIVNAIICLL